MTGEGAGAGGIGRVIGGRYRLIAELGSGGFGRVWRAHDDALQVDVAIKEVWLSTASENEHAELLARAEREARNAAKLRDHPNIVAVHDVVTDYDIPWIVMRLVEGASLKDHLARHGPLPVEQVARVAGALLLALQAADRAGIVHRDIKPGNVLIATDGQVLLTDFGIAVHREDTALTSSGIFVGSVEYMAPERVQEGATIASDLFSLGVTLYQAVEGISPFRRETLAASVAAVLSEPVPPPQRAGRLGPLIARLLEKEPGRRPSIADALALAAAPSTALPTPSRPDPARQPAWGRQQPAHPWENRSAQQRPSGELHWQQPQPDRSTGPGQSSRLSRRRFLVSAAGVGTAGAAIAATWFLTQRSATATRTAPLISPLTAGTPSTTTLAGHLNYVLSVAFSSDGGTLASGSWDKTVRLWDVSDPSHPKSLGVPLPSTDYVDVVAFAPYGRTLASGGRDNAVRLWDATDPSHPTSLGAPLAGHTGFVDAVAFAPDRRTLASGSFDTTTRLWDVSNPSRPTTLGAPLPGNASSVVESVAFSPDGHTLAIGTADGTIGLWDVTDPSRAAPLGVPLAGHSDVVYAVAFSPDGRTLASGSADNTILLWDVTNRPRPVPLVAPLAKHADDVRSVAFSSDGRTLASGSWDKTILLWNVTNRSQPTLVGAPLAKHSNGVFSVAFSPNGRTLASASADNTILLWDLSGLH